MMRRARVAAMALAMAAAATALLAQGTVGTIRGQVFDESEAAVPGVTVEVRVAGRVLSTVITDASGEFTVESVPAGPVAVTMGLDGFEPFIIAVDVPQGGDARVTGHLTVAALSERVTVTAPAPKPPVVYPPLAPLEPSYQVQAVPPLDLESVCGPAKPREPMTSIGTLDAHRQEGSRVLYRVGDAVAVATSGKDALVVGQNLVARRLYKPAGAVGGHDKGEYTAGVLQVVAVSPTDATAVVLHACGELRRGDLLMPFVPEPLLAVEPMGVPRYRDAARIVFGDADQMMGGPGRLMVIDRGKSHGLRAGQRLTLFRRRRGGRIVVGEAVVMALRADSARIRVERASDAIWFGDSAAPQEPSNAIATLTVSR